ncbi:Sec-independent protein translocase subunit TatA [Leifsonia sp. 21MFCrub1.1]|uniref:Sec-independent protein translocase subunit TatA n=1 Tax=Leifsonia sp. 21MFCrub1.1 TaxID=1798223 RepID=UPI0008928BFC|nr:Sec-independent protein translocase subunit TatA [Leifsonia sp. 21MFCrub1.1]SEA80705.1 sec-independent protein translocase protein TatA [Leifsonia sp. 21MFCrub1.1]
MFAGLTGWHLLIILAVILLLFGAPKLPALAKSIGQSMRIFKGEVDELKKDGKDGKSDQAADGTPTNTTAQNTAVQNTAAQSTPAPTPVDPSTESNPKS